MPTTSFQPDIAIHPGESLAEQLEAVSMSQVDLATRTGLTPKTVSEIVQGKNPVTSETAIKLASVFGTSPEYWNNKQRRFEQSI